MSQTTKKKTTKKDPIATKKELHDLHGVGLIAALLLFAFCFGSFLYFQNEIESVQAKVFKLKWDNYDLKDEVKELRTSLKKIESFENNRKINLIRCRNSRDVLKIQNLEHSDYYSVDYDENLNPHCHLRNKTLTLEQMKFLGNR